MTVRDLLNEVSLGLKAKVGFTKLFRMDRKELLEVIERYIQDYLNDNYEDNISVEIKNGFIIFDGLNDTNEIKHIFSIIEKNYNIKVKIPNHLDINPDGTIKFKLEIERNPNEQNKGNKK